MHLYGNASPAAAAPPLGIEVPAHVADEILGLFNRRVYVFWRHVGQSAHGLCGRTLAQFRLRSRQDRRAVATFAGWLTHKAQELIAVETGW